MVGGQQLSQLLSKLRAPIFNTIPATSNARTGTKYLRRRLRGPAVLNYHPMTSMPNIKTVTANTPWNKYYGWDGAVRCDADKRPSYHLPPDQVVAPGWTEVTRKPAPGTMALPPKARTPSKWLVNPREYTRFEDVQRRLKIGKGPPKKGELVDGKWRAMSGLEG